MHWFGVGGGTACATAGLGERAGQLTHSASRTRRCGRFIIGRANSTAYPGMRLPATGRVRNAACSTLRAIGRRIYRGRARIPRIAVAPGWGRAGAVRVGRQTWRCAGQQRGGSGPTFGLRCSRGGKRITIDAG
ncbi:MAG: hypothetical protein M0P31_10975 [Solirubrobacteraceae bacterium]|nr:hypothetical protein [Solirubrobacteraceae bacterium]